ncbi:MAG: GNAT family N-acetyltransferase [Candidatus Nanohaloarchaea archaeon]
MDAFGSATLNIYQNPEGYLEDNPGDVDRLVDVAQSAFDRDGIPTREDVEQHILPVSTLVTAEIDDELVGFSSTEVLELEEPQVYAVGLSVHEDYQGEGLGKVMRTLGVKEESVSDDPLVSTRTQNPAVLSYMQDLFDAYPREEETPDRIASSLEELARELDPEAEFDPPVMREAYPEAMYDQVPEHELKPFMDEKLEYEDGDAMLIAGSVSQEELEDAYRRALGDAERQFYID